MGERVVRALERVLMPWFDRAEHDREKRRSDELEHRSRRVRLQAEALRRDYIAAAERLRR